MIEATTAAYQTLLLANDDDAAGLNDLLFAFDVQFPGEIIEEKLRAAKQAVRDLAARGWVRLWFATWTDPENGTEIPDADSVLENPHWWLNHIDRMVWFAATDAGREALARPEHELLAALSQRPATT